MSLSADQAFAALEATWPAAEVEATGPRLIRTGLGGGKRLHRGFGLFQITDVKRTHNRRRTDPLAATQPGADQPRPRGLNLCRGPGRFQRGKSLVRA